MKKLCIILKKYTRNIPSFLLTVYKNYVFLLVIWRSEAGRQSKFFQLLFHILNCHTQSEPDPSQETFTPYGSLTLESGVQVFEPSFFVLLDILVGNWIRSRLPRPWTSTLTWNSNVVGATHPLCHNTIFCKLCIMNI